MSSILQNLLIKKKSCIKSFAILIDPDKVDENRLNDILNLVDHSFVDYFFVGGSLLTKDNFDFVVSFLKSNSSIPVVLFPGNSLQISDQADAILLLSLISGRNPDYLIGQHVIAAPILHQSAIEIISTGYVIISGGNTTAVSYISNTMPIPSDKTSIAVCTAMAGSMLGLQCCYLETGSGAQFHVPLPVIQQVSLAISSPVIVGGGIKTSGDALACFEAGADVVVVGTQIEKDVSFLTEIKALMKKVNA
jgi:putative glycerol-1-phosphate prenyltransferase